MLVNLGNHVSCKCAKGTYLVLWRGSYTANVLLLFTYVIFLVYFVIMIMFCQDVKYKRITKTKSRSMEELREKLRYTSFYILGF